MNPNSGTRTTLIVALLAAGLSGFHANALAIGSMADIQIVDRAENRRLPIYWHEGRAYVVGKPGNEYQISVRNRAGTDVLAVVSVDGVNAVSGETAAPEQTGYVLGNRSNYDIRGWRMSLDRTAAFYFTQLPDSYAARTGRPDNVGVIGVAVFRRKQAEPPVAISRLERSDEHEYRAARESARDAAGSAAGAGAAAQPPASAPNPASPLITNDPSAELARMAPAPEKSLGTGHGRSETSVVRNVAFERATPNPEEVITIYYDSQRNLMARGVIPAVAQPQPQPQPQPFPGRFVQDPPRG